MSEPKPGIPTWVWVLFVISLLIFTEAYCSGCYQNRVVLGAAEFMEEQGASEGAAAEPGVPKKVTLVMLVEKKDDNGDKYGVFELVEIPLKKAPETDNKYVGRKGWITVHVWADDDGEIIINDAIGRRSYMTKPSDWAIELRCKGELNGALLYTVE